MQPKEYPTKKVAFVKAFFVLPLTLLADSDIKMLN